MASRNAKRSETNRYPESRTAVSDHQWAADELAIPEISIVPNMEYRVPLTVTRHRIGPDSDSYLQVMAPHHILICLSFPGFTFQFLAFLNSFWSSSPCALKKLVRFAARSVFQIRTFRSFCWGGHRHVANSRGRNVHATEKGIKPDRVWKRQLESTCFWQISTGNILIGNFQCRYTSRFLSNRAWAVLDASDLTFHIQSLLSVTSIPFRPVGRHVIAYCVKDKQHPAAVPKAIFSG